MKDVSLRWDSEACMRRGRMYGTWKECLSLRSLSRVKTRGVPVFEIDRRAIVKFETRVVEDRLPIADAPLKAHAR